MDHWTPHGSALRLGVFVGLLLALLALERLAPRRRDDPQRRHRWPTNLALVVIDSSILALLPLAAVSAALRASAHGYGLLNVLGVPAAVGAPLAFLALDLALYVQHRALHEIAALWPMHRVHHCDVVLDVTTGVRFHPIETTLSMLYKIAIVSLLGAPVVAVIAYELALNAFALWSHANWHVAPRVDSALRRVVITPDTHRVHHSVHRDETDSNYGSVFTFWDRLFGSFRAQPRDGHEAMAIGLPVLRDPSAQRLAALLAQPLRRRSRLGL